MDILERLNSAIDYVESTLCDDIDIKKVAKIALNTPDGFLRLFSYLVGISLSEYIRRRRLTLAANELQNSDIRVIDVAVKYGYTSADAFNRAFTKQHGLTPSCAKKQGVDLKIYPPISFHILIKGVKEMNFKIIETENFVLRGLSKTFTGVAADRFDQEHIMWSDPQEDIRSKVSATIPGKWYGIWDNGTYWIARKQDAVATEGLEEIIIPSGKYAVFCTGYGGFAGDELPNLRDQIFGSWLTSSGYRQTHDYEIEVYHLYSKDERQKRHYELWIPIENI